MKNIDYKRENISKEEETMITVNNNMENNIKDDIKSTKRNSDDIIHRENNKNLTKKEEEAVSNQTKLKEPKEINSEIENNQVTKYIDIIFFRGKEYLSFSRYNNYNLKKKIKR